MPEIEDEKITESEQKTAFSIISLAFKEDNKWRLYDGSNTLNVTLRDEDFLRRVENNTVSFAKGDVLICRLKTIQWRTETGLKSEHEVIEVIEHKPAARQLTLLSSDHDH